MALVLSLAVAMSAYFFDRTLAEQRSREELRLLTRQLANQVESLASTQKDRSPTDGLRFAVSKLNQAPEPRVLTLSLWETKAGARTEEFEIKGKQAVFSYVVFPTEGIGIRLTYERGFRGFFGMRSRLASDLTFLGFAGLVALALVFALKPGATKFTSTASESSGSESQNSVGPEPTLHSLEVAAPGPDYKGRLEQGRARLIELGGGVRGVVRNAHLMAVRSGKIRIGLQGIQSSIATEMERIHDAQVRTRKQIEKPFSEAEVLALNLVLEAGRLGAKGAGLAAAADQLHKQFSRLRKISEQGADELAKIEQALEPIAAATARTVEVVSEVVKASHELGTPLKKTTESLGEYSKIFDEAI
jgi:hypothetical protein